MPTHRCCAPLLGSGEQGQGQQGHQPPVDQERSVRQGPIVHQQASDQGRPAECERQELAIELRTHAPARWIVGGAEHHRGADGAQDSYRAHQQPVDVDRQTMLEHHSAPPAAAGRTASAAVVTEGGAGSGDAGRGRFSSLAKNVSMTWRATGAARYPCSPCSAKTTPAMRGSSRGAANTNHPWSRRSRSDVPAAALLPDSETTCAVPVLPMTSRPCRRARRAVPTPFTAIQSPWRTAATVSGSSSTTDGAGNSTLRRTVPSSSDPRSRRGA